MKKVALGVATATAALSVGLIAPAPSAHAVTPAKGCHITHQLGATAYVHYKGITIATVRQYTGTCSGHTRRWADVTVTNAARAKYRTYTAAGVWRYDRRSYYGLTRAAVVDLKSIPVYTGGHCTSASGAVGLYDKRTGKRIAVPWTYTAKKC